MMSEKKSTVLEALIIGAKLLLICAIVAGLVSLIFGMTKDKYAENLQKTKDEAVAAIFETEGLTSKEISAKDGTVVYAVYDANGGFYGYCVETAGKGFGGDIGLMVGYDAGCEILGVRVVSHSETPGLGAKITNDSFLAQYKGQSGSVTLGEDVDAIVGATISSKAVTQGINQATEALESALAENGGAGQ